MCRIIIAAAALILLGPASSFGFELQLQPLFKSLGYDTDVTLDEIEGDVFFQVQQDQIAVLEQISALETSSAIGWYTDISFGNWLVGGMETGLPTSAQLPLIEEVFGVSLWTNYSGTTDRSFTWYSERLRNSDKADHARVYKTRLHGQLVPHSYLLAWEDLENLGDADFQDMVIRLDGVQAVQGSSVPVNRPVPEPAAFAMFLVGLAVLVKGRR